MINKSSSCSSLLQEAVFILACILSFYVLKYILKEPGLLRQVSCLPRLLYCVLQSD